jgi:hypothetical protein
MGVSCVGIDFMSTYSPGPVTGVCGEDNRWPVLSELLPAPRSTPEIFKTSQEEASRARVGVYPTN